MPYCSHRNLALRTRLGGVPYAEKVQEATSVVAKPGSLEGRVPGMRYDIHASRSNRFSQDSALKVEDGADAIAGGADPQQSGL